MDSKTAYIYPNVTLGDGAVLGLWSIIGEPPRGAKSGEIPLRIGDQPQVRSHTVIYAGNVIGNNFQTGHRVSIRESNKIGDDVSIGTDSVVEHHVEIGNRVRLHTHVFVPEYSILEDEVWVGPAAVLTNARYPNTPDTKHSLKGPTLKAGCVVGANVTLLPGVVIGERAVVGAGSVVTKDVPAGMVVVGNPAKVVGKVEDIESYRKKIQAAA